MPTPWNARERFAASGAAAAYVREGFSNIRIGMFWEIATTLGALGGALLAARVPTGAISLLFGLVLLYSAYPASHARRERSSDPQTDPLAFQLKKNQAHPRRDILPVLTAG